MQDVGQLLLEMGYLGVRQGRIADALVLLRGAVGLRPEDPTAPMFMGMAHFAEGRYVEAERTYREALELHGDDDLIRTFLGESLIAQRRWTEAEQVLETVVGNNEEPDAVAFAGELLTQLRHGLFQRV